MIALWFFLQALAGLLMCLAHPFRAGELEIVPGFLSFLSASIGIAAFMKISSLRSRALYRFGLGFWGGLVFYMGTLYWLVIALSEFGNLPMFLSIIVASLLAAYCALFLGVWSMVCGLASIRQRPIFVRILIWASLWAGLECLREYLFTGFGWGEIGYHFSFWPFFAQSAAVWGVHGLTFFWIVFVSLLLHIDEWGRSIPHRIGVGVFVTVVVLVSVAGVYSYQSGRETQSFKVSLIQPNVDQGIKWSLGAANRHLRQLVDMTFRASQEDPDLIVWPETSYPASVRPNQKQMPFSSNIPLIVGAVVSDRTINKNSALLVKNDQIQQRFDKIHLVPFGEYVPLEDWMPFEKMVANVGRFLPGSKDQQLLELSKSNVKMGPLICYEDIFSRHSVRHARRGANLLLNITNDAWYGRSSALRQHGAIARMQSYQTGLPMLRATNTGLTSTFDLDQYKEVETYKEKILTTEMKIPKDPRPTWFTWTFPLMEWIWWGFFAIAFLWKGSVQTRRIFFREPKI